MSAPAQSSALDGLADHADHPSAYLALNQDAHQFRSPRLPGSVAYYRGRRHAIQLFGPLTAPEYRPALLREFLAWAGTQKLRLCAVQVRAEDTGLYAAEGFAVNQLGSNYSIDLSRFTLRGRPLAKVRQNTHRAIREGIEVSEVSAAERAGGAVAAELDAIDASWLRAKGRHVRELAVMIGERGGPGAPARRIFLARRGGEALAYVSYSPAYGSSPGWLYDLTRRHTQAPQGTIEFINRTALAAFTAEGAGWLHLGLTPFAGLAEEHHTAGHSRAVARFVRLIAEHGSPLYPARTQEAFKLKWAPHLITPEYVAFQGGVSPGALWHLLRATHAV